MSILNDLASQIQRHVPVQPWSFFGTDPLPVTILYDGRFDEPWQVKFVTGVKGKRRAWARVTARTLEEALRSARDEQTRVKTATEAASSS